MASEASVSCSCYSPNSLSVCTHILHMCGVLEHQVSRDVLNISKWKKHRGSGARMGDLRSIHCVALARFMSIAMVSRYL